MNRRSRCIRRSLDANMHTGGTLHSAQMKMPTITQRTKQPMASPAIGAASSSQQSSCTRTHAPRPTPHAPRPTPNRTKPGPQKQRQQLRLRSCATTGTVPRIACCKNKQQVVRPIVVLTFVLAQQ